MAVEGRLSRGPWSAPSGRRRMSFLVGAWRAHLPSCLGLFSVEVRGHVCAESAVGWRSVRGAGEGGPWSVRLALAAAPSFAFSQEAAREKLILI